MPITVRRLRRSFLIRDDRGAAMTEFAVALPLLLFFAFGIIDFGRAFYVYNALNSIARDGARFGAALNPPTATAIIAHVDTVARQYLDSASASKVKAFTTVTPNPLVATQVNSPVTVTIARYPFTPVVLGWWQSKSIDITKIGASATFRREW